QSKLWRAFRVVFVAKGHRFQFQDSFARFLHRFDLFLELPCRSRRLSAEPASAVDIHRLDRSTFAHVINTGDKGAVVSNGCADPNLSCVARYSQVADIDIVATIRGEIGAGISAQPDVVTAGGQ